MGQATLIHVGEDGGEKTGGPPVVSVRKSGTGYRPDSQMVEAFNAGFQTGDAIPQTRPGRKLHGKQVYQLAPSGKRSSLSARAVLGFQFVKMRPRNQFEQRLKYCVTMGHCQKSPVYLIGYGKPILTDSQEFSGLFDQLTGQKCGIVKEEIKPSMC
jgi:hypothetical protein